MRRGAPIDDESTLQEATDRTSRAPMRVPALTILAHADATRVGDIAIVVDGSQISRAEPVFAPPIGGAGAALGDRHLSRRPAVELRLDGGRVRVIPAAGSIVALDGRRLDADAALEAAELDAGVPLEIGDRVALLVHRRTPPRLGTARHGLVGHSEALERTIGDVERVGDLGVPVLLTGPTGAGKELVARAIHAASPRAEGPLIAVSMAALTPATAASQLFGHVRGAFTGADRNHPGLFAAADGGTLFLDEIAEAPPEIQAMLLRALEERAVLAVGATATRPVDVRLIAATDADLDVEVATGRFKAPLLHRLAGFRIRIPGLSERRDDIGRLLVHFVREELAAAGEPDRLSPPGADHKPWLPPALVARLVRYAWPGNVRELRNVARHIVIANRGRDAVELAPALTDDAAVVARPGAVTTWAARRPAEISEDELIDALRSQAWRTGATAAALGISRTSLYQLMDRSDRIRKARDLSREEILRARDASGGGIDELARLLEVSERGLKLRIRELGLDVR